MDRNTYPAEIAAKAEAFLAARRGWSGGMTMAVTAPADVPDWIPGAIISAFYDRVGEPELTLTSLATQFNDLQGKAGQEISVPYAEATTPADNLAVNVPATDDSLTSGAYTLTIKEGVKSIAWYDRTQVQSGQDVNALAGRRVGTAMEQRIELDLGAALIAGRDTGDDAFTADLTIATIRAMRKKIPSRLRKNGLVLVGPSSAMDMLFDDATVNNVGIFGSDEVIRNGALTRPLYGVTPYTVDDDVFADVVVGANPASPPVIMFAKGMLAYGFQKNPSVETERDARARLTRHVGTMLHGEGTLEAEGIVLTAIGNA
jgi:hypothetical protein